MERTYAEYAARQAMELLAIDSPTGFTARAADWVQRAFEELGYTARHTAKGGVLVDLGGRGEGLLLEAHADTLGGMVAEVKNSGRLRLTPLGGMRAENGEAENVRVYTRGGRVLEGTFQLCNASVHVNGQYGDTKRTFDSCEVVLDEDVKSAEETRTLGVEVGYPSAPRTPAARTAMRWWASSSMPLAAPGRTMRWTCTPTTAPMWRLPCRRAMTCATVSSAPGSTPATATSAAMWTACGTP